MHGRVFHLVAVLLAGATAAVAPPPEDVEARLVGADLLFERGEYGAAAAEYEAILEHAKELAAGT